MGRGSSKNRDTKKDGLTEAQTARRERKLAKRAAIIEKKGGSKPAKATEEAVVDSAPIEEKDATEAVTKEKASE